MKRTLLSLLVYLIGFSTMNAEETSLNLMMTDGTIHSFMLSVKPILTIENDKLIINTDSETISYDLFTINQYSYGNTTSIGNIITDNPVFLRHGDKIILSGVKDITNISVHDINGIEIPVTLEDKNSNVIISLTGLRNGIYLIKANNTTIKISKK